jgi:hypothetical protein
MPSRNLKDLQTLRDQSVDEGILRGGGLSDVWRSTSAEDGLSDAYAHREHRLGYPDTVKRLELLAERDNVLDLVRLEMTADGPASRRISEAAPLDFRFLYPILPELLAARGHRSADRSLGTVLVTGSSRIS